MENETSNQEFIEKCNAFAKYIIAIAQRDFNDYEKHKLNMLMGVLDDAISYDRFVPMSDEQYQKWSKRLIALFSK